MFNSNKQTNYIESIVSTTSQKQCENIDALSFSISDLGLAHLIAADARDGWRADAHVHQRRADQRRRRVKAVAVRGHIVQAERRADRNALVGEKLERL